MERMPDLDLPEYSRFSEEQKKQIRELYSWAPAKIDEEGLRNAIETEWKNTPPCIELPRYNADGTRRQQQCYYSLVLPKLVQLEFNLEY